MEKVLKRTSIERINHLDGFRGLAILLVVLFHAFTRWSHILPYGNQYSNLIFTKYGWIGVQLFFMLSGFVIYMSLDKCNSFKEFIFKRWLRLFPAMFIISLIVFLSAKLLSSRPQGLPQVQDLIPGLFFIEPLWISKIFGIKQGVLEGAFWSLFVEMKFYFIFGAAYFCIGRRWAKYCLAILYFLTLILKVALFQTQSSIIENLIFYFDDMFSFNYFGWFLIGVLAYEIQDEQNMIKLILCCFLGLVTSIHIAFGFSDKNLFLIFIFIVSIFLGSFYSIFLQRILSIRPLLFLGYISYPLYLCHENFMIAVIRNIGFSFDPLPGFFLPVIPLFFVSIFAYFIAKYIEPFFRSRLRLIFSTVIMYNAIKK